MLAGWSIRGYEKTRLKQKRISIIHTTGLSWFNELVIRGSLSSLRFQANDVNMPKKMYSTVMNNNTPVKIFT